MRDWTLAKIVWVTDRGFSSEQNRQFGAATPVGLLALAAAPE
jgi:hypothetical protein